MTFTTSIQRRMIYVLGRIRRESEKSNAKARAKAVKEEVKLRKKRKQKGTKIRMRLISNPLSNRSSKDWQ